MTALLEGALDLSSKPLTMTETSKSSCPSSPVPSLSPEPSDHASRSPAHSPDLEGSMSTPGSVKTPPGMPFLPSQFPANLAQLAGAMSAMAAGNGFDISSTTPESPKDRSPGGPNRPFKMYPFEGMSPAMYTQLAAAAAASGTASLSPFAPQTAMPFSLFDSGISLTSPIGQYLQSRKRRAEARVQSTLPPMSMEEAKRPKMESTSPIPNLTDNSVSNSSSPSAEERKDDAYWERRRKNNEAAKRSRDARRAKEEEIALRAAFLEQENLKLRAQVAILKNETAKLHYMLYNRVWEPHVSPWMYLYRPHM